MVATTGSNGIGQAILDVVLGEALYASTLATLVLTSQLASGRLSDQEAERILDGASLVLEKHRGANVVEPAAIDHALDRLNALVGRLRQLRVGVAD